MTPNIVKGSNSLPADRSNDPNHPRNDPKYQPAGFKKGSDSNTDTGNMSSGMDGDHAAKTMDAGASSALNATDMGDAVHEDAKTNVGAGTKETGSGTSVFSKHGAIGSQFTKDGNIGGIGEKVGGPFAASGTIGQAFNPDGAVGGTFQKLAEKNEQH